jgi:hypothetical protein
MFWQNCKKNNVDIFITRYPINLDYAAIEQQAKNYGLKLFYQNDTDSITKTTNYMPFDLTGSQNIKESFRLCFNSNFCITLSNGRMNTCSIIQSIHIFNKYFNQNLQVSEKDSIDIYKVKSIDEILDFLCKPIPFCRYCNWKKCKTQIPWHISKKDISEWT